MIISPYIRLYELQTDTFAFYIKMSVINQGQYIFTQLFDFLPKIEFDWYVKKYEGNKYIKYFTC